MYCFLNLLNQRLKAVQNQKALIRKRMDETFEISKLVTLKGQLNILDKEETDILNTIGDIT